MRFIFSHSALREGWDNPNVFVMGMLKKSDNTISRRQEIGRGLRLAVDQHGERMDNPVTVHDINELTVVTDESYTDFVAGLQKEIAESLSARPRKAKVEFFEGKVLEVPTTGEKLTISNDQAKQLQHWLTVNEFIDYDQQITDKWRNRADIDIPPLPAGLEPFHYQVAELVDSLILDIPQPTDGRKPKRIPLNEANFAKKEFQELWGRINHKAVYQVEFDSTELIAKCVTRSTANCRWRHCSTSFRPASKLTQLEADDLAKGEGFTVSETTTTHGDRDGVIAGQLRPARRDHREDPAHPAHRGRDPAGCSARHVREVPAEPRAVHHRGGADHQRAEGHGDRRAPDLRHARRSSTTRRSSRRTRPSRTSPRLVRSSTSTSTTTS